MNNPAEAPLYPYPPDYTNSETALAPVSWEKLVCVFEQLG